MNQLGNTELLNSDSSSYACKDMKGNIQVLLWDFTCPFPGDSKYRFRVKLYLDNSFKDELTFKQSKSDQIITVQL